jgi:DNA repair exonuclease SbcCD nuclease subunit
MVKIIHAADFHLDSPFASLGEEKAALRRREQREQLGRIALLARDADMVLLSGDLFDSSRAYGETVDALRSFFEAVSIPVFVAPGNHDFYAPMSPYAHISFPGNVHVFTDTAPQPVVLEELNCVVWGTAFLSERQAPPLRGFSVPDGGAINVMVCHGDTEMPDSRYGSIKSEDIEGSGLDYLALGHIHTFSGIRSAGRTVWAYPGCPLGRGFDETGEKGVIRGTVSKQGCELEFLPLPERRYVTAEVDVSGCGDIAAAVRAAVPADAAENIYRITLSGEWDEKLRPDELKKQLEKDFWHLELRDATVLKKDIWAQAAEDTLKGNFLRILKGRYDSADSPGEKEKIVMAARYGIAALEYREDM